MKRGALAAVGFMFGLLAAGAAHARDECRIPTRYDSGAPAPVHPVKFVFTGVDHQPVQLWVDDTLVFEGELSTEDWSTEFSGRADCLMAGRYRIRVKVEDAEGALYLGVSDETTIYLSGRPVITFNVWGPGAPGLD